MEGSATVPAAKVATPVALSVVNAPVLGVVAPTVPLRAPENLVAASIVPSHVSAAESANKPPVLAYVTRPEVRPESVMLVEVTTPLIGPENPAAVNVVPLNVRFAESCSRPAVPAYVTRPEVRPESVMLVDATSVVTVAAWPYVSASPLAVATPIPVSLNPLKGMFAVTVV